MPRSVVHALGEFVVGAELLLQRGLVLAGSPPPGLTQSIADLHQAWSLLSDHEGWLVDLEVELVGTEIPSRALRKEVARYLDTFDHLLEQFRVKREIVLDSVSDKHRPRPDFSLGAVSMQPPWIRDKQD